MTVLLDRVPLPAHAEPPAPLWLIDLTEVSREQVERFTALLDPAERAKADRFATTDRRLQHIVAHGLKRLTLGHLTGERPERLRFALGDFGKPYLADHPAHHFSLSHCDGLVGIAVARRPVGLDLEPLDRPVDDRLAARFLPEARPDRIDDRIRLWTLKEAYLKATGSGLNTPLEDVRVSLDPPCIRTADHWKAWQAPVGARHIGAIVLQADFSTGAK